jgi:hypothetical protein
MRLISFIATLFFCLNLTGLSAQELAMAYAPAQPGYYTSTSTVTAPKTKKHNLEPVVAIKRANKIPAAYSGFAIVVAVSELPLLSDDQLFRQFGNLTYDQNPDGTYSYLILTPFQKKKNVKRFFERIIKGKAPQSCIVKYNTGKRKTVKAKA